MSQGPAPVVDVAWVWRSRWLVALTHALVVLWSVTVGLPIHWPSVGLTLAVSIVSNTLAGRLQGPVPRGATTGLLALDLGLLTLLLLGSGGIRHPFTFL